MQGLRAPLQVHAAATNVTLAATPATAETAIPLLVDGVNRPKFVYVASSLSLWMRPGLTGVAVDETNGLLLTALQPLILNVAGQTHIGHKGIAGSEELSIVPLENMR